MAIDYHKLKNWSFADAERSYTEKDTMLYALGLGFGADPLDENQLSFVYEKNLRALPTMAVILGFPGFWISNPETGIDATRILHGEQGLTLHKPLPAAGTVIARLRVTRIVDKGVGKGALVFVERTITEKGSDELLATVEQVTFCRAEGGFTASGQPGDTPAQPLPPVPEAEPEAACEIATRPEMALVYRLSGDVNPLHADPAVARAAGFPRPILHGLATYGVAGHAILKTWCDYDPARLKSLNTRFSAPVFPGETIRTEMWKRGSRIHFRARVVERDTVVLNNGFADIA